MVIAAKGIATAYKYPKNGESPVSPRCHGSSQGDVQSCECPLLNAPLEQDSIASRSEFPWNFGDEMVVRGKGATDPNPSHGRH